MIEVSSEELQSYLAELEKNKKIVELYYNKFPIDAFKNLLIDLEKMEPKKAREIKAIDRVIRNVKAKEKVEAGGLEGELWELAIKDKPKAEELEKIKAIENKLWSIYKTNDGKLMELEVKQDEIASELLDKAIHTGVFKPVYDAIRKPTFLRNWIPEDKNLDVSMMKSLRYGLARREVTTFFRPTQISKAYKTLEKQSIILYKMLSALGLVTGELYVPGSGSNYAPVYGENVDLLHVQDINKHKLEVIKRKLAGKKEGGKIKYYPEDLFKIIPVKDVDGVLLSAILKWFASSFRRGEITKIEHVDILKKIFGSIHNSGSIIEAMDTREEEERLLDRMGYTKFNLPNLQRYVLQPPSSIFVKKENAPKMREKIERLNKLMSNTLK